MHYYPSSILSPSKLSLLFTFPSCLFYSGFSTKTMYAFLLYCMYATSPFCHFPLDFIALLISGKKHISWSSSMCNCHQLPLTSSPLCMNNLITLSVKVTVLQTVMPWGTTNRYQHFTQIYGYFIASHLCRMYIINCNRWWRKWSCRT